MTTLEKLQEYLNDDNNIYYGCEISSHEAKEIVKALQFQQSVVKCKDCKHKVDREFGRVICMRHSIETHKCGYCHNGERRDEE